MATTYKVRYKNHCTPQEQIEADGRWYLDSDCGRRLTGVTDCLADPETAQGALITATQGDSAVSLNRPKDFVYVKNTGSSDLFISLTTDDTAEYVIVISGGEAFAADTTTDAEVFIKCASGETTTVEKYSVT